MKGLNLHAECTIREEVTEDMTAVRVGSGSLRVLGTPVLIALMERAACEAISMFLEDGETTVGTAIDMDHTAPSAVGRHITVKAKVDFFTKREIVFRVTAHDDETCALIGSGTHTRVVVNAVKFQNRADGRISE